SKTRVAANHGETSRRGRQPHGKMADQLIILHSRNLSMDSTLPLDPRRKIWDLDALAEQLAQERARGKKVVHCHGVFDLLHIGHVRHFEQARRMGDLLVVTLTPDRWVNKGPHRPAFP